MKKKWIILISVVVVSLAGAVWFNGGGEQPVEIKGDLSAKDVADIKGVVRRELRRRILPGFSMQNIKELPTTVKNFSRLRIRSIQLFTTGPSKSLLSVGGGFFVGWTTPGATSGASVIVSAYAAPVSAFRSQCFVVTKGATGWGITNVMIARAID